MEHAPTPPAGGAQPAPEADPGALVGAAVRARRSAAGLSVAELARRAGVSGPFVSQLEGGRSSVSIPVLYRLAAALGCAANDLLPPSGERRRLTRAGGGPRLRAGADGPAGRAQRPRLLTRTGEGVLLEGHHYVLRPGEAEQEWFAQPGEVFVHVLAGRITVEFADGGRTDLDAGDSLHHEGELAHRWLLRGGEPAEVLVVLTADVTRP
ncbi:helix-turn-helix domain-containing protein [Kineococcus sp. T13]|uniref:helix-turn-helix domain-containing protein n=1 Tax=Kineococcus vitellinus TaxID=2696565 RepID=UPI0014120CF7|nr:helix-turn-helix domain-containing protein [Kineococcus vitellinus]